MSGKPRRTSAVASDVPPMSVIAMPLAASWSPITSTVPNATARPALTTSVRSAARSESWVSSAAARMPRPIIQHAPSSTIKPAYSSHRPAIPSALSCADPDAEPFDVSACGGATPTPNANVPVARWPSTDETVRHVTV